jgi:hypothetical protein
MSEQAAGVHVPPPPAPHLLAPPPPQTSPLFGHVPHETKPPHPSASGPHSMPPAVQSATVRGVHPLLPPQMLGVPPPPQIWGAVHVPHEMRPPQPSARGPQLLFGKSAHVFGLHEFEPVPHVLAFPPPPHVSGAAQVPH